MTLEIATKFASMLDRNDFENARRLFASHCVYEMRGEQIVGPDAILASYKASDDFAQSTLDVVHYESHVRETDGSIIIGYIDRIQHNGKSLVHRCEQRVEIGEDGLVERIVHCDLPGEVEALNCFFAEGGISRDT